jgi:type IV secretory pathway VirB2 component (pilin)
MIRISTLIFVLFLSFKGFASAGCDLSSGFTLKIYNGKAECIKCENGYRPVIDNSSLNPSVICIPNELKNVTSCNKLSGVCTDEGGVVNVKKITEPSIETNKNLSKIAFASATKQGSSDEQVKSFLFSLPSNNEISLFNSKTLSINNQINSEEKITSDQSVTLASAGSGVSLAATSKTTTPKTTPSASSGGTGAKKIICDLLNILAGKMGYAIATIAVIVLGVNGFIGKLTWVNVFITAFSIILLFGAVKFAGALGSLAGISNAASFTCT